MTAFEDGLWTRLVEEHGADRVILRTTPPQSSNRPLLIGGGLTSLAALAAVVAVTATTGAQPAYALTQNSDGTITVTINDLQTAIPQLNARFAAMGINETVIPVDASCQTTPDFPLIVMSGPVTPKKTASSTLTFSPGQSPGPGYGGVLAAETLPNGEIAMTQDATKLPVPSCIPASDAYKLTSTTGAQVG